MTDQINYLDRLWAWSQREAEGVICELRMMESLEVDHSHLYIVLGSSEYLVVGPMRWVDLDRHGNSIRPLKLSMHLAEIPYTSMSFAIFSAMSLADAPRLMPSMAGPNIPLIFENMRAGPHRPANPAGVDSDQLAPGIETGPLGTIVSNRR